MPIIRPSRLPVPFNSCVGMRDRLSKRARSRHMAAIGSRGNRSTELVVVKAFRRAGISGWRRHPIGVTGRPDFYFPRSKTAVFVHGCFWHGCARCARNTPRTRAEFWLAKIADNQRRDRTVSRVLRRAGIAYVRIWEHELAHPAWLERIHQVLTSRSV